MGIRRLDISGVAHDPPANENLFALRHLTERAGIYRAISARAALVGGGLSTALSAAMLHWQNGDGTSNVDAEAFYQAWLLVMMITMAATTWLLWDGARERGDAFMSGGLRLATRTIVPTLFAGIATSAVLTITTRLALFPALMWIIFYGLALLATMNFAPRSIIMLGWAFLFTGVVGFVYFVLIDVEPEFDLPTPTRFYPAGLMGVTFGLYHLVYAALNWSRPRTDDPIQG